MLTDKLFYENHQLQFADRYHQGRGPIRGKGGTGWQRTCDSRYFLVNSGSYLIIG